MPAILTLGLLALTATVADSEPLSRSTAWKVDTDGNFCRLSAEFGKNDVAVRFYWYGPGTTFDLTLIGNRVRNGDGHTPVKVDFGFGPIETVATTGTVSNHRPMVFASMVRFVPLPDGGKAEPAITAAQINAPWTMEVTVDRRKPFRIALGQLTEPMATVGTCIRNMIQRWNYDPEVVASLSRKPAAQGKPETWINSADYPVGALMANNSGVVRYRLDVDEQGKVVGCNILFRTRPDAFADATCAALTRRAQFTPALDAAGKPVRAFVVSSVTFRLVR